ncbi:adenosine deaminase [Methylocystis sp. JAN1]|uniref:adenosine deaminase n=1 Tax=Methylocystis sp. JAN1 TaxID=3397211 RepID=UPI003FA33BB7
MDDFVAGLPKAELHLHIEGTLEPEMVFALAERNRVTLPYASVEALRRAYEFRDLQDFLDLYYQSTQALVAERDFYDLARAYLARARDENIRHAEIFFDPQAHMRRGVPFGVVVEGLSAALTDAARDGGPTSRLIMCFLRDLSAENAMSVLDASMPWLNRLTGVGLDSAEAGNPPGKFTEVFKRARSLGLRAMAHAGEEGPASYVAEALDRLRIERVDHGVHAVDDPALVARLAKERIALTVCPISNIRLRVYPDLRAHPLKRLMEAGVAVTVNSDDPAYFGGYLNANYRAVEEAFALAAEELAQLARNSFAASFLSEEEKRDRIAEIDSYVKTQTRAT